MRRTTIFLPADVHQRLRQEALDLRISMAQLIRTRLEKAPVSRRRHAAGGASQDPLTRVEGILRDGTLSRNIDETLYGD